MTVAESGVTGDLAERESESLPTSNLHHTATKSKSTVEQPAIEREVGRDETPEESIVDLNQSNEKFANVVDKEKESTSEQKPAGVSKTNASEESPSEPETTAETGLEKEKAETDVTLTETIPDADLIAKAELHVRDEQLLQAARALRKVRDQSLLQERHVRVLQKAQHIEAAVEDLTSSPDDGWTKQGESHGKYDTMIYYKVDDNTRLTAKIETPIEPALLIPLISVFNESELYDSCLPHFNGLGISKCTKLRQSGRGNQIIVVNSYMPWPLVEREAVIEATAVDDISENKRIIVKMETRYTGEEDGLIPPPENGAVRVDFDGGILFRKCPDDHPAFAKSKHPDHKGPLVLACLAMFTDAHVQYVPQSLINFVTRTVIGRMWAGLLEIAEGIRDGKRSQHAEAIAAKKNLYEWIEQRVDVMINDMNQTTGPSAVP